MYNLGYYKKLHPRNDDIRLTDYDGIIERRFNSDAKEKKFKRIFQHCQAPQGIDICALYSPPCD